jgi:hypothetical protein
LQTSQKNPGCPAPLPAAALMMMVLLRFLSSSRGASRAFISSVGLGRSSFFLGGFLPVENEAMFSWGCATESSNSNAPFLAYSSASSARSCCSRSWSTKASQFSGLTQRDTGSSSPSLLLDPCTPPDSILSASGARGVRAVELGEQRWSVLGRKCRTVGEQMVSSTSSSLYCNPLTLDFAP